MAQGRGRLSAEREAEVYDTVVDGLISEGYARLTYDAIATMAKCSKATLYRLWDNKHDLVLCALEHDKTVHKANDVDTGSLRGDLHAWARTATRDFDRTSRLLLAIAHACKSDPDLAKAARAMLEERHDEADLPDDALARAVARGEIAADRPALTQLPLILSGPLLLFDVLQGEPLTTDHLTHYIDTVVLPALGLHP